MTGGYGGPDLYMIIKNKDGTWSDPKNLGNSINSSKKCRFHTRSLKAMLKCEKIEPLFIEF